MFLFFAVPSVLDGVIFRSQGLTKGIATLVLFFFLCVMMLGFLSSKRYGLDRVATKHVVLSFRFAVVVALLAADVALAARRVYTTKSRHPTEAFGIALAVLLCCMCILLDSSPHVSLSIQVIVSVNAHDVPYQRVCLLNTSAGLLVDILRL
jgi:hypothetical protein